MERKHCNFVVSHILILQQQTQYAQHARLVATLMRPVEPFVTGIKIFG